MRYDIGIGDIMFGLGPYEHLYLIYFKKSPHVFYVQSKFTDSSSICNMLLIRSQFLYSQNMDRSSHDSQ